MERTSKPLATPAGTGAPWRRSGGLLARHEWREWRAHAALGALLHELRLLFASGPGALDLEPPEGDDARRLLELLRARGPRPLRELPGTGPSTAEQARALVDRLVTRGLVEVLAHATVPAEPVVRLKRRGEHYLLDGGLPGVAGLLMRLRDLTPDELEDAVRVVHRVREASRQD